MGHSNRLSLFWMSTALAIAVGCSINPQPEPPGLDVPTGSAAQGGASSVVVSPGGSYNVGVGGMQSSGTDGAANLGTGGARNDSASGDGGLRSDASSVVDSGDLVDASGS
jgi:hypothetical protein